MSITTPDCHRKPPLHVAVGIVRKLEPDGLRVLISRRHGQAVLGGFWEFPGGKIHPGESPQDAVRRELAEELAIQVDVEQPLLCVEHAYDHGLVRLQAFYCRLMSGRPRADGVARWRWVRPADLLRYPFPPANAPLTAAVIADLAGQR